MGDVVPFPDQSGPEPLWRELVGRELRDERTRQERTLADVAGTAGISVQYLSEVERGLKEPSSEVLGAVHGALGLRLVDLTTRVSRSLGSSSRPSGPLALAA
ncbi:helix-turn-helix transcriptional regulator [Nocardioides sp. C4-1]|uniref:helix-turn-helix domain-containing protein n=1 Tax=Nocardioides sp. C4-1 TaxID=3151851 RepID=UPI003267545B